MRILSVVRKNYYGAPKALEPMSLYFTLPLEELGHEVETFDHFEMSRTHGRERATAALAEKIEKGRFEVVFYQTSGKEPIETEALAEISKKVCIAAWNSDDDWQWETTERIAGHFTFMITTYPHIHEQNRGQYANLLLGQWGCLEEFGDAHRAKDIGFSFAGSIYGGRNKTCRYLRRKAGLICFGRGARLVRLGLPYFPGALRFPWLAGEALEFQRIHEIWNRSRISFTPLEASTDRGMLQIKGRLFEMGLSGTLLLCNRTPELERYYEPGSEYVTFESPEDCAEKAQWFLTHEKERARIAMNYGERTRREHLWTQRFRELFRQMGLRPVRAAAARFSQVPV